MGAHQGGGPAWCVPGCRPPSPYPDLVLLLPGWLWSLLFPLFDILERREKGGHWAAPTPWGGGGGGGSPALHPHPHPLLPALCPPPRPPPARSSVSWPEPAALPAGSRGVRGARAAGAAWLAGGCCGGRAGGSVRGRPRPKPRAAPPRSPRLGPASASPASGHGRRAGGRAGVCGEGLCGGHGGQTGQRRDGARSPPGGPAPPRACGHRLSRLRRRPRPGPPPRTRTPEPGAEPKGAPLRGTPVLAGTGRAAPKRRSSGLRRQDTIGDPRLGPHPAAQPRDPAARSPPPAAPARARSPPHRPAAAAALSWRRRQHLI